jgi:hypothetical protein
MPTKTSMKRATLAAWHPLPCFGTGQSVLATSRGDATWVAYPGLRRKENKLSKAPKIMSKQIAHIWQKIRQSSSVCLPWFWSRPFAASLLLPMSSVATSCDRAATSLVDTSSSVWRWPTASDDVDSSDLYGSLSRFWCWSSVADCNEQISVC